MLKNVTLGNNVIIHHPDLVNLYNCSIGNNSKIATFVEIQTDVSIGCNCKIEAFAFIPSGVTVGDGVFIGPHVCFINDRFPRAVDKNGLLLDSDDWEIIPTTIHNKASIGANSTILCGVTIGEGSMIAAGSVIIKDVEPYSLVGGNPTRVIKQNINIHSGV